VLTSLFPINVTSRHSSFLLSTSTCTPCPLPFIFNPRSRGPYPLQTNGLYCSNRLSMQESSWRTTAAAAAVWQGGGVDGDGGRGAPGARLDGKQQHTTHSTLHTTHSTRHTAAAVQQRRSRKWRRGRWYILRHAGALTAIGTQPPQGRGIGHDIALTAKAAAAGSSSTTRRHTANPRPPPRRM